MRTLSRSILIIVAALAVGCGDEGVDVGGNGDGGNGDGGPLLDDAGNPIDPDGGNNTPDAAVPQGCDATDGPECNNCVDDDGDGLIDGADPHCISAEDNDEASYATGIPGDNMDDTWQDCFFDGDSGAGNDGCNQHVCCILGAPDQASCPIKPAQYDPAECGQLSQQCIDFCDAITPPGCDCFGCCTQCNDTGCYDVLINPNASPNCDVDVLQDPDLCRPCVKNETCGTGCDPTGCILCPGQTEDDLPPECTDNACPEGLETCDITDDCQAGYFCANGCCIYQIP